jgi:predicted CXXCH cytochrome family protein
MILAWIRIIVYTAAAAVPLLLCPGCSTPVSRDIASLLFDGVPALPVPEKFCASWMAEKEAEEKLARQKEKGPAPSGSSHPPYAEKKCNSCHDTSKEGGLAAPMEKLCFLCHKDIIKGAEVHAPAVAGNCLACHQPHDSVFPSLLKTEKAKLCDSCHMEKRLTTGLHASVSKAGLVCTDCHDPHAGNAKYFLK